jgi:hypothetical protein
VALASSNEEIYLSNENQVKQLRHLANNFHVKEILIQG